MSSIMRILMIPAFTILAAGCSSSDSDSGPGLDRFNEIALVLTRMTPHVAQLKLARAINGAEACLVAGEGAGATYGGLEMALVSAGARVSGGTCDPVTFQVDTDAGAVTSQVVEIHDATRQVSTTFPAVVLVDRAMSLGGISEASAGDVVHVGWDPVGDLVQSRTVEIVFAVPGGAMWRTPGSIGITDLSFTAQTGATGAGTLSVVWGDLLTGPASTCDIVSCAYFVAFRDEVPFRML
jgi:hypothetical protein